MNNHIGACRFIWNYMIQLQDDRHTNGDNYLSRFGMINLIKELRHDGIHEWLCEISSKSLQVVCCDVDNAYKAMFNKISGHPKYKSSKQSKKIFPTRYDTTYFADGKVNIERVGKIKYKSDISFQQGIKAFKVINPRVSYEFHKWYMSFGIECESQAPVLTYEPMGIDLGVKELASVIHGEYEYVFHNINKSKKMRDLNRRIILLQRSISRKYDYNKVGNVYVKTRNIERCEEELRRLYRKQKNIRYNYIHQTTHSIVSLLPCRIVMEDINVSGMLKNKKLASAIWEQCFFEFKRQIQYKCDSLGIEFILADRFFPSSKTCSCCGLIKRDLKLSDRVFICECGYVKDRDMNAAINLMRYVG